MANENPQNNGLRNFIMNNPALRQQNNNNNQIIQNVREVGAPVQQPPPPQPARPPPPPQPARPQPPMVARIPVHPPVIAAQLPGQPPVIAAQLPGRPANELVIMSQNVRALIEVQKREPNLNHLKKYKQLHDLYEPHMVEELEDLFDQSWDLFEQQFPDHDIYDIYLNLVLF